MLTDKQSSREPFRRDTVKLFSCGAGQTE